MYRPNGTLQAVNRLEGIVNVHLISHETMDSEEVSCRGSGNKIFYKGTVFFSVNNPDKLNAIPIVNENDTIATSEIKYGDNDRLASRVAQITNADTLKPYI